VFDWNQIHGDVPLGSGGITIRGDMVESFSAHECEIPLDGQANDTGSVSVRLKWEPQLLLRKKTSTSFMGSTRKATTKLGTTAFNWSQPVTSTSTSTSMQAAPAPVEVAPPAEKKEFVKPVQGKLTVHVLEARGLKGDADKINPVIHLTIGKTDKHKTKKMKKTNSPIW
jgi:Ca2+-dependent lipid-binding protein